MRFIFNIILIAAAIVVGAALVVHLQLLGRLPALILGVVTLLGILLHLRQSRLSLELKTLKAEARGMADFEQDINRRLSSIEQGQVKMESANDDASLKRTEEVVKQLETLEKRLEAERNSDAESLTESAVVQIPRFIEMKKPPKPQPDIEEPATNQFMVSGIDIKEAVNNNGLTMHLQPMVQLPTQKPLHYEAFMRLKTADGEFLEASEFLSLAENGGLMSSIDKKVIFSAVRMLRTLEGLKKKAGLFCNLSSETLADGRTFEEISNFLQANSALNASLVLEISQRHFNALGQPERERLSRLADMGYQFSLDQVFNLKIEVSTLKKSGITFLKVPAHVLMENNLDGGASSVSAGFVANLLDANIQIVATEVEAEREAIALIDLGVHAAQGNVFAKPRAVKASLLEKPIEETKTTSAVVSISMASQENPPAEKISA